jgi:potassium-dependent mechanosensitive channel
VASAHRILTAELTRGALRISLGDVLAFAATIYAAFLISSAVRFVLQEDVFPRLRLASGLPYTLSNLLGYAIVAVGFIVALLVLGVNLDRFTLLGGAFGVGIGFGLQNVVNNFVSGLIVLFERPVRVGDNVQIGDVRGDVQRIGIRSSTVRTGEGAEVIVPNSMLVAEKVTNWTPFAQARRIDIKVNVAYGTAPDRVLKILAEVAGSQPDVSPEPAPLSLFLGFGASALGFELWVWTARLDRAHIIKSDLGLAVHAALTEAGISLAVPQQEIVVRRPPGPPR